MRNVKRDVWAERQRVWAEKARRANLPGDLEVSELGQPAHLAPHHQLEALRGELFAIVGKDTDLVLGVIVYGLSQREMGEILGLSHDAARKRYQRAVERLEASKYFRRFLDAR